MRALLFRAWALRDISHVLLVPRVLIGVLVEGLRDEFRCRTQSGQLLKILMLKGILHVGKVFQQLVDQLLLCLCRG